MACFVMRKAPLRLNALGRTLMRQVCAASTKIFSCVTPYKQNLGHKGRLLFVLCCLGHQAVDEN